MRFIEITILQGMRTHITQTRSANTSALDSVQISVSARWNVGRDQLAAMAVDVLRQQPWFQPTGSGWRIDLDKLREQVPQCADLEWLKGSTEVVPEYSLHSSRSLSFGLEIQNFDARLVSALWPERCWTSQQLHPPGLAPSGLDESLAAFRRDHPDPRSSAFIVMGFTPSKAHRAIADAIRKSLKDWNIDGLRADDKQYHDDLFTNVLTYVYGCGFGVAVFERVEGDEFNPNVALEVGYMFALGRPVCLLKDRTLRALPTDLVGKLYREFDCYSPEQTVPDQLTSWLRDKGILGVVSEG
ncbi:MAG: hypothetical protein ACHQ9S_16130 [Candidatus Binatia bacterium]